LYSHSTCGVGHGSSLPIVVSPAELKSSGCIRSKEMECPLTLRSSSRIRKVSSEQTNSRLDKFQPKLPVSASAIVLSLLTCGVLSAQNQAHPVRNIVLVHGAWAHGSGWKGVYDILVRDGYNVSMVQEPETSFKEDVAATKRLLALQDGPCILVAHSHGGAAITEAGTDASVAGLVYVAAHMPDAGDNEADDGKRFPSDLSTSGAIKKADGSLTSTPRIFMSTSQPTCLLSRPLS
jgi:pimeloyl-ACP methyl ester carboxylesterase